MDTFGFAADSGVPGATGLPAAPGTRSLAAPSLPEAHFYRVEIDPEHGLISVFVMRWPEGSAVGSLAKPVRLDHLSKVTTDFTWPRGTAPMTPHAMVSAVATEVGTRFLAKLKREAAGLVLASFAGDYTP